MTPSAPLPLSAATLARLPEAVDPPRYDRAALVPAVVHLGVGGFHRAHQAVYLDALARRGETGWGLVGVGMHSRAIGEVLAAQDDLWTVVERGPEHDEPRVVGPMTRYLLAADDPEPVLEALADERTRLVTLTITGTAYLLDASTGAFDTEDEQVRAELDDPAHPRTAFGHLVEALARRRERGLAGFTVLSCDNMPSNGTAARTAVLSLARARDERDGGDLAAWVEEHVTFPSSMVDRITPSTTDADREALTAATGVADRWPVVTEPFTQWVVEDDFVAGRPPLEDVGALLVDDVAPFETMKTRMLNASHTALGYLGHLAGHRTSDEVLADPVFAEYLDRLLAEEVVPLLPAVPGTDLDEYRRTLLARLANPRMGDDLGRLCRRGSTKVPNYLLPSVKEALQQGTPLRLLSLAVAGWMRYLRGADYAGVEMEVEDPRAERLTGLARAGGEDPESLLAVREVFDSLSEAEDFTAAVEVALRSLEQQGPREVIAFHLQRRGAAA